MKKHLQLFKKYPVFLPSISNSKNTWFWNYGIKNDGLLISYDVLKSGTLLKNNFNKIHKILRYKGFILLDNGAYGANQETDALDLIKRQIKLNPNAAIILDKIPYHYYSNVKQWKLIRETIDNARIIKKFKNKGVILMCVVQGNNIKQLEFCSKGHLKNKFNYFGIPLSHYSKNRNYAEAIEKFIIIKKVIGNADYHGLGCGSRTLIMLLSHLGMISFDSSSFYKNANFNKNFKPITFCSISKPLNIKECKICLLKQNTPVSIDKKIQFNLIEIQKEIYRSRCAIKKQVMPDYIKKRISKYTFKKIKAYL